MQNLTILIKKCDEYITYLKEHNIEFDDRGFPILNKEFFLSEVPDLIVPYYQRNSKFVSDRKKVVLCSFTCDEYIYRRFDNVFDDIDEYKKYMGVVSGDLTVTSDMDLEWQNLIMLLNQLYIAILAVNGVKILLNTRSGSQETLLNFSSVPKNIMCVSSFLGCERNKNLADLSYISKIMFLLPSKILLYGKCDEMINYQLNIMGFDYVYYDDFHKLCKEVN